MLQSKLFGKQFYKTWFSSCCTGYIQSTDDNIVLFFLSPPDAMWNRDPIVWWLFQPSVRPSCGSDFRLSDFVCPWVNGHLDHSPNSTSSELQIFSFPLQFSPDGNKGRYPFEHLKRSVRIVVLARLYPGGVDYILYLCLLEFLLRHILVPSKQRQSNCHFSWIVGSRTE